MKSLSVKLGVIIVAGLAIYSYEEGLGADWKLYCTSDVPGLAPDKAKFYHY
jgi:hypothetical protein